MLEFHPHINVVTEYTDRSSFHVDLASDSPCHPGIFQGLEDVGDGWVGEEEPQPLCNAHFTTFAQGELVEDVESMLALRDRKSLAEVGHQLPF